MADEIEVANLVTKLSIDDTGVEQSMAALNRQMKTAQTEFQAVSTKLAGMGTAEEQLRAKTDSLNKQMEIQAQKILMVKKRFEESASVKGADAQATQKLEVELNKLVAQYNKMHNELKTTESDIAKQASAWDKLSTSVNEAAKKMETAGRKMSDVGRSMTLMVTAPLAAVGAMATKASVDFDTAWTGVEKTVNGTEKELAGFKEEIRDMATEIPAAATAIARVAEAAGQLGIENESLIGFTRTMTDLGVATNMGAEEAATSLARLANITQMPQQNFDRLGSTIVALGNNFATTESEITAMGLRLAGAGHQLGMTEAQILGLSAGLSSVGIEAEAGGSAVSNVMVKVASAVATGGKDLQDFADVAGMSASQFKTSFQTDAAGAIVTFIEGLRGLSDSGENVFGVLKDLGMADIRVRDSLLRAAGAGDLFRQAIETGSKAWEENTALTTEAEKKYESFRSQMDIFNNKLKEAAITLGDALVPMLLTLMDTLEPVIQALAKAAEWFSSLPNSIQVTVVAVAAFAAALGPLLILAGQLLISVSALIPAVTKLGVAFGTWMLNPVVLGLTALAAVAITVGSSIHSAKVATEELKQAQEELQAVQANGITRAEVDATQEKIDKLDELTETYQKLIEIANATYAGQTGDNLMALRIASDELGVSLEDLKKSAADAGVKLEFMTETGELTTVSMKKLKDATAIHTKAIKDANRETAIEINESARKIAVKQQEITSTKNLLATYQSAKKGSQEYNVAQTALANMFPQLTDATGVNAEAVKGLLLLKEREIQTEWALIQAKAAEAKQEIESSIVKQQAALAISYGIMAISGASGLAMVAVAKMNIQLDALRAEAISLQAILDMKPGDFKLPPVVTPKLPSVDPPKVKTPKAVKAPKAKGEEAYENKALDEAYKKLEHLKALDQLTAEQELKSLETIRTKYIKTADERMEIEEKIHSVKKTLGDASLASALKDYERSKDVGKLTISDEIERLKRIKKLYTDSADEREDIDDRIYEATKRKIEAEKQLREDATKYVSQQLQAAYEDRIARETLSAEEAYKLQDRLLNDQIYLNNNYLKKVMVDDRYSAAEKKDIEREVTEEVRKQANERLKLQKDFNKESLKLLEDEKKAKVDSINNTSKGIQDALKAKYQAEKSAAEESIKNAQSANEEWKKAQLDSIKTVYDARIKSAQMAADAEIEQLNRTINAQIEAIQAELNALNKGEQQKSRAELDAADAKKINQLSLKRDYEPDESNRIALQNEINKVLAAQDKRHQEEQLADKKEALTAEQQALKDKLKEKTDAIKEQLAVQKELMQLDMEEQQARINQIYNDQKASLDQQLVDTQAHYAKLLEAKAIQAEAEKMIIQKQQTEIIKLLGEFGDSYNLTGQTLGEKMYQGFAEKVNQIQTLIASVNAQIDSVRSSAISAMNVATAAVSGGGGGSGSGGGSSQNSSGSIPKATVISTVSNFYAPVTSPSSVSAAGTKVAQQLANKL
ncbi:TP901 family phage tail tape measure protein [Paenibacillus sp. DS2015]|uniref:phage tail tape measure protein n=1 Tax=Paenibacillus sp. DS2015 TaxID=3373917 RepID=UPI003D2152AB